MRLRITHAIAGSIDGIQLHQFEVGQVHTVGTSVGSFLLALGAAEPVADDEVRSVVPPLVRWEAGERRLVPPADKPARRRK